jgi:hypothetical protein
MINVVSKTCAEKDCNAQPSFNYFGNKSGLYCSSHKLKDMMDVKHKSCTESGCALRPTYNYPGSNVAIYCKNHKLENMVNIVTNTCIYDECNKVPTYNYNGTKTALYCLEHKLESMVDIKHKLCIANGCGVRGCYNFEGNKNGIYCVEHKHDDMINVVDKTCKTPLCNTRVKNKYEGYCFRCYIYTFPDKPVVQNYKTKEKNVVEYVTSKFPGFTWVSDKKITNGCSKRRPDLLLDLGYQIIIVEIDENQHLDYDCNCENKRIMQLSQDLGHRPIVFIRFNPDGYKTKDGIKIPSLWHINGIGICSIKRTKYTQWQNRLDVLCEHIQYWSDESNKTDKIIENVHLFYDQL